MNPTKIVLCALALALAVACLPGRAHAAEGETQVATGATIAVGPPTPQVASDEPWMAIFAKIDGGVVIVPSRTVGAYGRIVGEGMLSNDPKRPGVIWGFWEAFEGWGAQNAGGFAIPVVFYAGYRSQPFVTTFGGGFNLFTIDSLDDDAGAGIFSPRGELRFGINTGQVLILATGEAQYRWEWGRDEVPMIQAGISLGWGDFIPPERMRDRKARR